MNVASIWGLVGVGQIPDAAYAASKGGPRTSHAGSRRSGPGTAFANALAPGWFPTEMTSPSLFGDEQSERWMRSRTPMGRGGTEHELDGALLFLAAMPAAM